MNYRILNRNVDPKVVGVTHGAGQLKIENDFKLNNEWNTYIFHELPRETKEWWRYWARHELYAPKPLEGLILEKRAKRTDFIRDSSLRGFYVNKRLKNILENAHLPVHNFIQTQFLDERLVA